MHPRKKGKWPNLARMEKKSNSELKREFQKRQNIGKAQLQKAKEKKPEFDKLDYPGKLKFMDDNFGSISGISDKGETIISIYPDENNPEQIRQYNEWQIAKWQTLEGELFDKYSFDRLKARFFAHIDKIIKTNQVPDDLIREYIEKEIKTYSEKVKTPFIQSERDFYKGNWDLSKRVIQTSYLMAQAYYNYLPFLKEQLNKRVSRGRKKKTFPEYLLIKPDENKIWFADQLKKEFNTDRQIHIRYMIEGLIKLGHLSLAKGQWAGCIEAIEQYFCRDIGDYQGIQNPTIKPKDFESAEKRIQSILDQIIRD